MKLNLGCGSKILPGYINVDKHNVEGLDSVQDLNSERWRWRSGSVDEIIGDNVLEHLDDVPHFFRECGRVLKPGGLLKVWVPFWHHTEAYHSLDHKTYFGLESFMLLKDHQVGQYELGDWVIVRLELVASPLGRWVPRRLLPIVANVFGQVARQVYLEAKKVEVNVNGKVGD